MREKEISLSENEKTALFEFKNKLREKLGDNFVQLKLFGSRARGEARPESDIDILVITKELDRKIDDIIIDITCQVCLDYDIYLEMLDFSLEKYHRLQREQWPFILNVDREGVDL